MANKDKALNERVPMAGPSKARPLTRMPVMTRPTMAAPMMTRHLMTRVTMALPMMTRTLTRHNNKANNDNDKANKKQGSMTTRSTVK